MTIDWTVSFGNILTIIGFIGGFFLVVSAIRTQVALLAQRVSASERDIACIDAINIKISGLQVKVDTMWEFSMRRAKGEAVISGLATINSPIILTAAAQALVAHLAAPLREFYDKELATQDLSDLELALVIEREFGERILHEVCIPNNLSLGACLIIAVAVARGQKPPDSCYEVLLPEERD